MLRRAPLLLLLASSLVACEERDERRPDVDGGGGAAEGEQQNLVYVAVVSRLAVVPDLDVLVHDADGKLLRRTTSAIPAVAIEADPTDSVSVVWREPSASAAGDGWIVDSVRLTSDTHAVSFAIDTDAPAPESPNLPVDLQIQAELADGVIQLFVGVTCGPTLATSGAATFLNYVGCPDGSPSLAFAGGLDAEGALVTFSTADVSHRNASQAITLPSTPVPNVTGRLEIDWAHTGIDVVQASTVLVGDALVHFDPFTSEFSSPSQATPPLIYEPRIAAPPLAARVHVKAEVAGVSDCGGRVAADTVLGVEPQHVRLDRLAFPDVAFGPYRWSLVAEGDVGDAVTARLDFRHGSYRWVEPAIPGEHVIVLPDLPDDLAAFFDPAEDDLIAIDVMHDDRDGTLGYAEYVSTAAGSGRGPNKETGSATGVGPCIGRY